MVRRLTSASAYSLAMDVGPGSRAWKKHRNPAGGSYDAGTPLLSVSVVIRQFAAFAHASSVSHAARPFSRTRSVTQSLRRFRPQLITCARRNGSSRPSFL